MHLVVRDTPSILIVSRRIYRDIFVRYVIDRVQPFEIARFDLFSCRKPSRYEVKKISRGLIPHTVRIDVQVSGLYPVVILDRTR